MLDLNFFLDYIRNTAPPTNTKNNNEENFNFARVKRKNDYDVMSYQSDHVQSMNQYTQKSRRPRKRSKLEQLIDREFAELDKIFNAKIEYSSLPSKKSENLYTPTCLEENENLFMDSRKKCHHSRAHNDNNFNPRNECPNVSDECYQSGHVDEKSNYLVSKHK